MRTTLCVVIAALVSAAPALAQGQTDPDAQEIASYRLSMDTVNKVAAATRVMAAEMKKDPRFQEVAKVDAEIKALEKKEETTEAEDAKLEELKGRREELSEKLAGLSMGNAESLSAMEAQIRKVPPLMAGLQSASLTPREYAKFMLAALQAGMVAGLKKQGLVKEVPKQVSAENVAFMEAHEADFKALQKEWEALGAEGK